MRHPNLELFRARLRDLIDLGVINAAAGIEIAEERGALAKIVPELYRAICDFPASGPLTTERKALILAVIEDLSDDLIDAWPPCLCTMCESCESCSGYNAVASCRKMREYKPIPIKLDALDLAAQIGTFAENLARESKRMIDGVFLTQGADIGADRIECVIDGLDPIPSSPRYILAPGAGKAGRYQRNGANVSIVPFADPIPLSAETLRQAIARLGPTLPRAIVSPDVAARLAELRPDLVPFAEVNPLLAPATWMKVKRRPYLTATPMQSTPIVLENKAKTARGADGYFACRPCAGLHGHAVRSCWNCGCTDEHACEGGCWWVSADLCSTCHRKAAEASIEVLAKIYPRSFNSAERGE